ncbi:hypothetical protein HMPREF9087_1949 [Enterococcus casseliflavus ATCC 12755]|uniref:Uncharacterized protein n=1 Tax=Enterococcus casseliflavus ATCC 12755 TaxID=888066 RepID=F0EKP3_ENTCA|nr:hypothetical protein HMPREF9087_1949 [Enterococcus casseliflavus ATCC 12755]
MNWLTFVVQPLTLLFFLTVFSLVYLMPESLVPKPKMKKWALTVSLIFLSWQLLTPLSLLFLLSTTKKRLSFLRAALVYF